MNMIAATAAFTGGTALAVPADPIFAAIEDHKAAHAAMSSIISDHSKLESALPLDKRQSTVDAEGEKIVETDDPHWIESERAVWRSYDDETDAACVLVAVRPTTIAGVLALLNYANAADDDGEAWPCDLVSDDGKRTRHWHYFLTESVAAALTDIVA